MKEVSQPHPPYHPGVRYGPSAAGQRDCRTTGAATEGTGIDNAEEAVERPEARRVGSAGKDANVSQAPAPGQEKTLKELLALVLAEAAENRRRAGITDRKGGFGEGDEAGRADSLTAPAHRIGSPAGRGKAEIAPAERCRRPSQPWERSEGLKGRLPTTRTLSIARSVAGAPVELLCCFVETPLRLQAAARPLTVWFRRSSRPLTAAADTVPCHMSRTRSSRPAWAEERRHNRCSRKTTGRRRPASSQWPNGRRAGR
jgi:hypothetical protein